MYDTIQKLYRGDICPKDNVYDHDKDFKAALEAFGSVYRKIDELSHNDNALMEELAVTATELASQQERLLFCEGFRLGMRLAAECFFDHRQPSPDAV